MALLLLLASPFVGHDLPDQAFLALLLAVVLFTAVGAATPRRHERLIAAALAGGSGAVIGIGLLLEHRIIYLPALGLLAAYLAYTILVILRRMVTASQIDADILCGAAAIYLLLGVAWAVTYWMIYELDEGAFAVMTAMGAPPFKFHSFLYYSLSCLTSLGMGDITPINRFAQIWTALETVTANLYIAVLVARLVSLYR